MKICLLDKSMARTSSVRWFLRNAGESLKRFRYYETRLIKEALRNHLITAIGWDDEGTKFRPVAYGHLDRDAEGRVWLGLCVAINYTRSGRGRSILQALIQYADEQRVPEVSLSVDVDNFEAKRLYMQFGFEDRGESRSGRSVPIQIMTRRMPIMDTFGSLIDKLATVNQKMFINQELLYEIRRMTFDEFKMHFSNGEGMERLWSTLKKACDLNVQRAALVTEVDEKIVAMVDARVSGHELDDGANIQRPHKTY